MDENDRIVTLTDEAGNEHVLELIDFVDYEDVTYGLFTPYEGEDENDGSDDEEIDVVVLRVEEEGENISLEAVTDEALAEKILQTFTELVADYEMENE